MKKAGSTPAFLIHLSNPCCLNILYILSQYVRPTQIITCDASQTLSSLRYTYIHEKLN